MLIFVTKKANSEEFAGKLKTKDFEGPFSAFIMFFSSTVSWVAFYKEAGCVCLLYARWFLRNDRMTTSTLLKENACPKMTNIFFYFRVAPSFIKSPFGCFRASTTI